MRFLAKPGGSGRHILFEHLDSAQLILVSEYTLTLICHNIGSPKWNHRKLSCGVRCTSICVKINPCQPKAMANHSHKTEDWEEKQSPTKARNDTSLADQYRSVSMAQFYPTNPWTNYLLYSKEKYIACIRYMNLDNVVPTLT